MAKLWILRFKFITTVIASVDCFLTHFVYSYYLKNYYNNNPKIIEVIAIAINTILIALILFENNFILLKY